MQQRAPKTNPIENQSDRATGRWLTLVCAMSGAMLLWAAFPPLDLYWLCWIAPVPWIWLVLTPTLPGRRPYSMIWLAGFAHWLAMLQGIRLAHPALIGGWIALALYLAFYLPLFVALARTAVHRLGVSVLIAAPVAWVGLELARGYLLTGFSVALLGHTLGEQPLLIQIADLGGDYAVSFAIMLVAACLGRMWPLSLDAAQQTSKRIAWWPLPIAVALLAVVSGYGAYRLSEKPPGASREPVRVALIQGSLDTKFEMTPERVRETYEHYRGLTDHARRDNERLDLVVWPESMFIVPERQISEPLTSPPDAGMDAERFRRLLQASNEEFAMVLSGEVARVNALRPNDQRQQPNETLLLVGTTTFAYGPHRPKTYNAALLAGPQGNVIGRYYKMHAVMFGEYIPLGDLLPWIYRLTPMHGGLSLGEKPVVFDVAGMKLSPSICFESTVPHLMRSHVRRLTKSGTPPDAFVNITNDGWFWGTAILDLHHRCAIFRAIENRKPIVVAANTGISTWIDGDGRVQAAGPRRAPQVIVAELRPDGRTSLYYFLGDVPAWFCAFACIAFAALGWRSQVRRKPVVER